MEIIQSFCDRIYSMYTPFTQTNEYLRWHEALGTKTFYKEFFVEEDIDVAEERDFQIDEERQYVHEKKVYAKISALIIPLRIGNVLYVPYGPVLSKDIGIVKKNLIIKYLQEIANKENCVFVRLEDENNLLTGVKGTFNPLKRTFRFEGIFQPRVEWWKNLEGSENDIYESLSKNHRYSVRKFEKDKGEIVYITNHFKDELDTVYNLLEETSKRDHFHSQEKEYVEAILTSLDEGKMKGFIVYSKVEGKINGFALVILYEKVANYLLGGSTAFRRDTGSSVHLVYKAIIKSKELGANVFNFGGIVSDGFGRPSLEGVTNFKKQFGGFVKFHGNFVDIPVNKLKYFIYLLRKMF